MCHTIIKFMHHQVHGSWSNLRKNISTSKYIWIYLDILIYPPQSKHPNNISINSQNIQISILCIMDIQIIYPLRVCGGQTTSCAEPYYRRSTNNIISYYYFLSTATAAARRCRRPPLPPPFSTLDRRRRLRPPPLPPRHNIIILFPLSTAAAAAACRRNTILLYYFHSRPQALLDTQHPTFP
jgi:hypothetical protein